MAFTAQMIRPKEKTSSWNATFPKEQVTEVQSNLFIKKLLAISVSNIMYLRAILPEKEFGNRILEDLRLKILSEGKDCPGANQIIKWIRGCFDALDKKYLRRLMIGDVIEAYTFKFGYSKNDTSMTCNGEEIATLSSNSSKLTRKATLSLLRTIVILTQGLDPLPDSAYLTMKILYYDDITPPDYQPPGFMDCNTDCFFFKSVPICVKVGDVTTPFHTLELRIKTDRKKFEEPESHTVEKEILQACNLGTTGALEDSSAITSLQEGGKPQEDIPQCNTVPFKSPTKPEESQDAMCSIMNTKEQLISCSCCLQKVDPIMLTCAECNSLQHGMCYGIMKKEEIPSWHVCEECASEKKERHQLTDYYLSSLPVVEKQALCIWRRTLVLCSKLTNVEAGYLREQLDIDKNVVACILKRLEKEGYIASSKRHHRNRKTVKKKLIISEAFPKYLRPTKQPLDMEDPESEISNVQDKSNCQIESLTDETEQLSLLNSKTYSTPLTRDTRKRFLEEKSVFEISDSQDTASESTNRNKRRKSSVSKTVFHV
ncbi:uncharacterized protein LOC143228316 [Tachypleus tridentatus]|uniref:uncharacterized protein LOC143228316 n=1 Tax=Tachypleus tridentatus TaxID=6853 RepID=UPI003FD2C317